MTSNPSRFLLLAVVLAISFILAGGLTDSRILPFKIVLKPQNTETTAVFSPSRLEERKTRAQLFEMFAPQSEFVMVGDSITHRGNWAEFLPNYSVANRGIGGDTTEDVLRRMDAILNVRPRAAFIMVGVNDLSQGMTVEEIFANYKNILEILRANDVTPVIQSTLACRLTSCGNRNNDIAALNDLLKRHADESGIMFLDINTVMVTSEGGLHEDVTNDGLHLNGIGYRRWVDFLEPVFGDLAAG